MQHEVTIIGAGIGGLTLALALKRTSIPFKVYEAAQEIKPVGAGIMLAPNAMQVYDQLGIKDLLLKEGNSITEMLIMDAKENQLSSLDIEALLQKYGWSNVAILRASLHQVLFDEVGAENVYLGKRLQQISYAANQYTLQFEDTSRAVAPILIGADGLHSIVREQLIGKCPLRDSQQMCWRGVTDFKLPASTIGQSYEMWHQGTRFGYVQVNQQQVYWYFVANNSLQVTTTTLSQQLEAYPPIVQALVRTTEQSTIYQSPIKDLKPLKQWYYANGCLLGDAAHATTPNMGQGACQAIEDAYYIAQLLSKEGNSLDFRQFQRKRQAKVNHVVQNSWLLGKVSHWENPLLQIMRNKMMQLVPKQLVSRQFQQLYRLEE